MDMGVAIGDPSLLGPLAPWPNEIVRFQDPCGALGQEAPAGVQLCVLGLTFQCWSTGTVDVRLTFSCIVRYSDHQK